MPSFKLVLPEHLNHYGYLFGGHLLQWVGVTSVGYLVEVFDGTVPQLVFSTQITFVGLGSDGAKTPLPS